MARAQCTDGGCRYRSLTSATPCVPGYTAAQGPTVASLKASVRTAAHRSAVRDPCALHAAAALSSSRQPDSAGVGAGARLDRDRALPDRRGQVAAAQLQRVQRMEGRQHDARGVPVAAPRAHIKPARPALLWLWPGGGRPGRAEDARRTRLASSSTDELARGEHVERSRRRKVCTPSAAEQRLESQPSGSGWRTAACSRARTRAGGARAAARAPASPGA